MVFEEGRERTFIAVKKFPFFSFVALPLETFLEGR
jgi:hypothetical protein